MRNKDRRLNQRLDTIKKNILYVYNMKDYNQYLKLYYFFVAVADLLHLVMQYCSSPFDIAKLSSSSINVPSPSFLSYPLNAVLEKGMFV